MSRPSTAERPTRRPMRAGRAVRVLVLGMLAFSVAGSSAALGANDVSAGAAAAHGRAAKDRPDDISGAQVHFLYVVPRDGTDRGLDSDGTIASSVANIRAWLGGQTRGKRLRVDTFQGQPDVTFLRLAETNAQVQSRGAFVRDLIEREVRSRGLLKPDKLYGVYYDGTSTFACGGGAWPPALPGVVAALYMPSTFWNTTGEPCYRPELSRGGLQLMDLAMLHELFHTMGSVAPCARHFTAAGHVSDSPTDLMYAGPEPWRPSVLDVGRDDYYGSNIPGCSGLSNSPYLASARGGPGTRRLSVRRFAVVRQRAKNRIVLTISWRHGTGRVKYAVHLITKLGKKVVRKKVKGTGRSGSRTVRRTLRPPGNWRGKKVTVRLVVTNAGKSLVRTRRIKRL